MSGMRSTASMRTFAALLAAVTGLGTAVGLGTGAGAASASKPTLNLPANLKGAAPSSVKIGIAGGYTVNHLPVLLASGAGLYDTVAKRFHTSISVDLYGGGSTAEPAFLGGTDQWLSIGQASFFPANLQGKDQVAVLLENQGIGIVFSGPYKYKATRGTNVSAYGGAGNTWCQISPIGSSNTAILLVAADNHINVANQNLTTIGSVANTLPSLQSGQCAIVSGDTNSAATGQILQTAYPVVNTDTVAASIPLAGEQAGLNLTTSHAFISQYPKLSQAIVDATLASLLFIQQNANNPNLLYTYLPSGMQASISLGAFVQTMQLFGDAFSQPKYNNGEYPLQVINDSVAIAIATKTIASTPTINPSQSFSNILTIQAYKDLGKTPVGGPATGPAKLPTSPGKPSQEAAQAVGELTGQPAPPNSGPSPMGAIATTTTTAAATTTSS
jgi:hypothetical protein